MTLIVALLENVKFAHTIFALPFALMSMFMAVGSTGNGPIPPWGVIVLVLVCMVTARSAAMTANRIWDLPLDRRNPRTQGRPMVTGQLSTRAGWVFMLANAVVFLAACAMFELLYDNPWPLLLAGAAIGVLCLYPLAKRFTLLSHFWLGAALGLSPIGAWLATEPATFGAAPLLLAAAVLFWTAGFDILYACQDVDIDRREGLHAIPAKLGVPRALLISRGCHALTAALLIALGLVSGQLGIVYAVGAAVAIALLAWEQSLIRPTDLSRINVAFFTINGLVSISLAIFAIADVVLRGQG
jgi:4-hydroxybenzoate polyprenyltransferase